LIFSNNIFFLCRLFLNLILYLTIMNINAMNKLFKEEI